MNFYQIMKGGGGLNNRLLRKRIDHLNIFIRSAAGKSPWSNGITEGHNAILGNMISKLMLNKFNEYPMGVLFAWGNSAKNALQKCYGYSPNQLVVGQNLELIENVPGIE